MSLLNGFTIFFTILTISISVMILMENRSPSRTVAWLLVLILLPVIGIFLYLYIGQNHKKKRTFIKKSQQDYRILSQLLKEQASFTKNSDFFLENITGIKSKVIPLLMKNTNSPITVNNESKILQNGKITYEAMLESISLAEDHIHMEYFIIKDSGIGRRIRDALIEAANRGVKVRVLYDAVGSWRLNNEFLTPLKEAGVRIEAFLPVSIPLFGHRLNYRNHRKNLIVDGTTGFLGGINIGDEYLGMDKKLGFWRDTHLQIKGEVVYVMQAIFLMDWFFVTGEVIDDPIYFPRQGYCGTQMIQVASSGPDSQWEAIHQAYFTAIAAAKNKVYITTPYLIPDESILIALKTAALRGVDVRIIVPSHPDHRTVFWASRSHFRELLQAGVKIYEYKKGFIHGKVMLVDDDFVSIGTANVDIRSFHLNFEINAFIYDKETSEKMMFYFIDDFRHSREITLEEYHHRPYMERIKESVARLFSPIL
ncbi:cardiolipin synthase [Alkaliphilus hydrothermalis]|uniref:Cardiolipin synthase n=1 Tax=Alkaliphilus hydrothermalis TaxID=1482730 RepID=A0ABS2NPV1_9FIRM|nr:cardiolipin synthase [Alkaliphilus hydrothermalis]